MSKPNCAQCRHFYITWDARTPNGCRQYGIQSKEQPSRIVSAAGAGDCQGFEPKKRQEAKKDVLDLNRSDLW
jgi:hypothetical protein